MDSDSLPRVAAAAVLFGLASAAALWLLAELKDPTGSVRLWLAYRWDDVRDQLAKEEA